MAHIFNTSTGRQGGQPSLQNDSQGYRDSVFKNAEPKSKTNQNQDKPNQEN